MNKECENCGKIIHGVVRKRKYCVGSDCYKIAKIKLQKKWVRENPERVKRLSQNYHLRNKDRTKVRRREIGIMWYKKNRLCTLIHYGGNPPVCSCCKEYRLEFLAVDHVNGGGGKHHKELKKKNTNIYTWLRKNNFPSGFQILCHNCNMSKGFYGYCPHNRIFR